MQFIKESNEIYVLNESGNKIIRATFPFLENETKVVNVNHTYVTNDLRGQGIASKLMDEVYNYAKEQGYTLVASCPYAVAWFKKNKDKQDIINREIEVSEACVIWDYT